MFTITAHRYNESGLNGLKVMISNIDLLAKNNFFLCRQLEYLKQFFFKIGSFYSKNYLLIVTSEIVKHVFHNFYDF